MAANVQEKTRAKYLTELDPAELALRIAEAAMQIKRPSGSAIEVMLTMDAETQETWLRAAHAALQYFGERVNALKPTN